MEECNICLNKIKKRRKFKHEHFKKRKYFSNLIVNKYIVCYPEIDKVKDIIQPYFINQKMKFDNFTICVMWEKNDVLINKSSAPSTIAPEKPHLFKACMIELPIVIRVSPLDFLDTFDKNINDEVDEKNIIFISDLKENNFFIIWINQNQWFTENL